jgi:hypothetical protein
MPTLQLEEYQYTDTGVLLNGDASLPFFDVESIDGLDVPDYSSTEHAREGMDGAYIDAPFLRQRTITIEGTAYTEPLRSEEYLDSLKANFAPTRVSKPFYFQTDAGQRMAFAKPLGFRYPKNADRRLGIHKIQIQLGCEDPRNYTPGLVSSSTTLQSVNTGGRSYPKDYPVLYGAAASNSTLNLTLGGNRDTGATLRITGPVVNPSIIFDNTGTTMAFQITLSATDYLEIDLISRAVRLNGSASRRSTMSLQGNWFLLEPGVNSFRYFGTQFPATPLSTLQVSAYSAWR